ncbi:MAG: hypothetical protein NC548_26885 [Lachnospiraceae bacterium]|nr:hypothetical protein [Lachnospiraceae bacterium]
MASSTKNRMWLDTSGMEEWIESLDKMGADVKKIADRALTETAEKIQADTEAAMQDGFLPAKGKYATGRTKRLVLSDVHVKWEGGKATVNVGFDQTKPGADIYLITGTPKMKPDRKLNQIFRQKKYMSERTKEIAQFFKDELEQISGDVFD